MLSSFVNYLYSLEKLDIYSFFLVLTQEINFCRRYLFEDQIMNCQKDYILAISSQVCLNCLSSQVTLNCLIVC